MLEPRTVHVSNRSERAGPLICKRIKNLCAGKCEEVLLSVASAGDQNFAVRQQGHLVTATPLVHIACRGEQACSRIIDFGRVAGDLGVEPTAYEHPAIR